MGQVQKMVELAGREAPVGTGWLPPRPDLRDYTETTPAVAAAVRKLGLAGAKAETLPKKADLRKWCSDVEDQGGLGSCTAHAAVGIVEYYENRAFGRFMDGSRLFVYKATRNLMKEKGDTGAYLRNTMGALVLCGVPPETYWKYTDKTPAFDKEPPAFIYALAERYQSATYFCHDPAGREPEPAKVVKSVKKYLAAGIPAMFGFYGFPSYDKGDGPGCFPYPGPKEEAEWGHAIVAVGYDDAKKIVNTKYNVKTTGAFLIRNSWGPEWGDKGYGWLPYQYVLDSLAEDFWSLLSMAWVETGQFGV